MDKRAQDGSTAPARIEGVPCAFDEALGEAHRRLARSRRVVFTGLDCDLHGVRTAIGLAREIDAIVDPTGMTGWPRHLAVLREAGLFLTTPGEARTRADTLLFVGPGALHAWDRAISHASGAQASGGRRLLWLAPSRARASGPARHAVTRIAAPASGARDLLAALRACVTGRGDAVDASTRRRLAPIAQALRATRFGIAAWSDADLDPLTIEMLAGLVGDLNRTTRFSCLPLADAAATGAALALTWSTGFPAHIGFTRGLVEHDPWRFEAKRLIASGEADLALTVGEGPAGATIALAPGVGRASRQAPAIEIRIGRPGVDHDSIGFAPETGGFAFRPASAPSDTPSAARVLAALRTRLDASRKSGR